jgi:hypothetical protein
MKVSISFRRQAALDAAGRILAVLAEAGEPGDFVFMDLRIDVENARAAAMLVERAIAQFVQHRAGGCALQYAKWPEAVRNDGDHAGLQPHLVSGQSRFRRSPIRPFRRFAKAARRGRRHSHWRPARAKTGRDCWVKRRSARQAAAPELVRMRSSDMVQILKGSEYENRSAARRSG